MATPYDVIVVGARCARFADRDVARPEGLPGAGRRPGHVPERHRLHALHPPAGRRVARALGAARRRARERLSARHHLLVRLRAVQALGIAAAHRRRGARRTARAAPCSTRSSSMPRPSAGAEVREQFIVQEIVTDDDGRVTGIQRSRCRRCARHRGGDGRRRRRRPVLDRSPRPSSPSSTTSGRRSRGTTTRTGATCRSTGSKSFVRPHHGWAAIPTNDDLTLVVVGRRARAVRRLPPQRRVHVSLVVRLRAGVRRAHPWREARGTLRRHRRPAELLPQALRPGLGARRRRGLPQGPAHRVRHHRRVPRRRAPRRRARSVVHGRAIVRRRDAELPAAARRSDDADVRAHLPARGDGAAAARDASSCSARCSATRRRWTTSPA